MVSEKDPSIYHELPGGAELLRWFGEVPFFGDGEIISLELHREGQSTLKVHGWTITEQIGDDGRTVLERHAVVSFILEDIMDLQLGGFSCQNVIGGLILRRAPDRPERRPYLALEPLPRDIEIELVPCYGMDGFIRARSASITFKPGKPDQQD